MDQFSLAGLIPDKIEIVIEYFFSTDTVIIIGISKHIIISPWQIRRPYGFSGDQTIVPVDTHIVSVIQCPDIIRVDQ